MEKYVHTVKYYETDRMGFTHHSNYVRWMEEARAISWIRWAGATRNLKTKDLSHL